MCTTVLPQTSRTKSNLRPEFTVLQSAPNSLQLPGTASQQHSEMPALRSQCWSTCCPPTVSAKTQLQRHFLSISCCSPHIRKVPPSDVCLQQGHVSDHPHPKQWVYRGCLYGKCTGWMNRLNNTKGDTQKIWDDVTIYPTIIQSTWKYH